MRQGSPYTKNRTFPTGIHFKDGDIVHKGDLLFTIDPRPYEIRLA
jgi:multidrug efflux pump subunit AcrA (membrane-fusion protein)